MPSDHNDSGVSDEAIDNIVRLVEAAEQLAQLMGMPVSRAVLFMLKGAQLSSGLTGAAAKLPSTIPVSKRVS